MNTKTDDKKIDPNSLKNTDFLERILRGVESVDNKEISVNVKSKKFKPKESFVIMFTGVTLEIMNKLSFAEFKVLLAYSHFMQYEFCKSTFNSLIKTSFFKVLML